MATGLGIARSTVVYAFEQLVAEGYLEGIIGSGTSVSRALPGDILRARSLKPIISAGHRSAATELSRRAECISGTALTASWSRGEARAFRPGLPALDEFPHRRWAQLTSRHWRRSTSKVLDYGKPAGDPFLRQALANYLREIRGVRCEPEQIVVFAGSQQTLDLNISIAAGPGRHRLRRRSGVPGRPWSIAGRRRNSQTCAHRRRRP